MKKRMKERYPKMKVASVQPGEENLQKGIDVTKSYLSANPDTTGVFGITTVALPGVAEAVRQLGLKGKVQGDRPHRPGDRQALRRRRA